MSKSTKKVYGILKLRLAIIGRSLKKAKGKKKEKKKLFMAFRGKAKMRKANCTEPTLELRMT